MSMHMGVYGEKPDVPELLAGCNRRFEVRRAANGWLVTVFYEARPASVLVPVQESRQDDSYAVGEMVSQILQMREMGKAVVEAKEFESNEEGDDVENATEVAKKILAAKKAISPPSSVRAVPWMGGVSLPPPPETFLFTKDDELMSCLAVLVKRDGQRA